MPPKKPPHHQPEAGEKEGATGGAVEHGFKSGIHTGVSVESSLVSMAEMFEGFMQLQKYTVLNQQVTQLQMDLEAARTGQPPAQTAGVPRGEPKLQKLEDYDDIEHFITTLERLAEVYNWPR